MSNDSTSSYARLYNAYVSSGQANSSEETESATQFSGRNKYLEHIINTHFPSDKKSVIFDGACGHGTLIYCAKQLGYQNISGVDISAEQVALAHRRGLTEVKQGNIQDALSFRNDCDVITFIDVLEHLSLDELFKVLDAAYAALRQGGILVVHVPNAEGLHGMRIRYGDLTHQQAFTPMSMRQVLTVCGFSRIRCFEDRPVAHGFKSTVRSILWTALTITARLRLIAETGKMEHVLSQNMLTIACKAAK